MLNRRYLRIQAMQALYGFFQSENADMPKGERELMRSIDKTYELYIYLLLIFEELVRVASNRIDIGKEKHFPTPEELKPNLRFVNNRVIAQLSNHKKLHREAEIRKLTWQMDDEMSLMRKMWESVKVSEEYKAYMSSDIDSYLRDQEFLIDLFKKFIADDDTFEQFLEEKNMHWPGDLNMAVAPSIIRTLESGNELREPTLAPLFKDPEEDKQFIVDLYRKTIVDNELCEKLISEKTKNWEVDRIAVMDVILMKMAISELLHFTNIPVKVTLNEYIEISKTYSTPKSKQFINGILDKIVMDFRKDGTMQKTGRGLME
ncbi:MAG TPA: transcription antitermination factor NusB [Bacteroidia bacterium]|nr:transcription antitermination factor NusB [Bacteroidia bacterium]